MTGHAFLAPSSAFRWGPGACPASPSMEILYPEDEESRESREGTAAHFVVSEALGGRTVPAGTIAPNGHPVDAEMIDASRDYVQDVLATLGVVQAAGHGQYVFGVEQRVAMAGHVHADNWGTPDAYLLDIPGRRLHVWDFKYGHRYVDAWRNWQCLDYAIGVMETHAIPRASWRDYRVTVTVAQPRNYHPDGPLREWHFDGLHLEGYADELRAAAIEASTPGAKLRTGDHCRDCRARHACPALQAVAMALVDMTLQGQPIDLPPAALGMELLVIRAAMKRLSARAEGLEAQALSIASKGGNVPHWRADYSYGRQRWAMPAPEVIELGKNFGIDLAKPTTLTPQQAVKAGMDAELVKALSETPRGGMALVPFEQADIAKRFR